MKYKKGLKLLVYLTCFIFLFSYVASKSGYFEYNLQNRKKLTEKEIKKFEQDVSLGKNIDINDYLRESRVDYSNKLTKTTSRVSLKLNKYLKKTLNNTFNLLGRLIK